MLPGSQASDATIRRLLGKPLKVLGFLMTGATTALADTPAFDRPGIAFSTSTIPRGSLAIELGVPDFLHDSGGGSTSTTYRFDTNFRTGLSQAVELELAAPIYNYDHTHDGQRSDFATGFGDTTLSLKATLPARSQEFTWALLASVTFVSGAKAFTGGSTQYQLATSMVEQLDDTCAAGLYVQLNDQAGSSGYTLSPSLGFIASPTLSGYFEAAYSHASHSPDTSVAGAGLAWMVTPVVQLDLSLDVGLTRASPQLQGGFGVSVYVARL